MKVYIVEYDSPPNAFKGYKVVAADNLSVAQSRFFEWLTTQPQYSHLWQLSFKIIGDNHRPFEVY